MTVLLLKCCFTSTETVGLLGTGAQDGHLDFHTPPELCGSLSLVLYTDTVSRIFNYYTMLGRKGWEDLDTANDSKSAPKKKKKNSEDWTRVVLSILHRDVKLTTAAQRRTRTKEFLPCTRYIATELGGVSPASS